MAVLGMRSVRSASRLILLLVGDVLTTTRILYLSNLLFAPRCSTAVLPGLALHSWNLISATPVHGFCRLCTCVMRRDGSNCNYGRTRAPIAKCMSSGGCIQLCICCRC